MTKLKVFVLSLIFVQLACSTLTGPSDNPSGSDGGPASNETSPEATATLEPFEFTPDYFSKVTILHDYWPAIARAANLDPAIPAETVLSVWNYSPDGRYIAAGGCDAVRGSGDFYFDWYTCDNTINGGTAHPFLFILDAHTEEIVAKLPVSDLEGSVGAVEFSYDGSMLNYTLNKYLSPEGLATLWDIDAGKAIAVLSENAYYGGVFSPDDSMIVFDEQGTTKVWDVKTQQTIVELQAELDSGAGGIFSPDGRRMLLDSFPADALYEVGTWKKLSSRHDLYGSGLHDTDYSPDLTMDALCDLQVENDPVEIYDVTTNEVLKTLPGDWGECSAMDFSPDGKVLFRFDITGRGLVAWTVDDWQMYDVSDTISDKITPEDKYVKWPKIYALDGRSVMIPTFTRLLLLGIP